MLVRKHVHKKAADTRASTEVPSTTKVMVYWLNRANISFTDQPIGLIILRLLRKTALLYAFFATLFQEKPSSNLLTLTNVQALKVLIDTDPNSTLAALRALDNAGKLTQRSFCKIATNPSTALFIANELGGIPDEKDKALIKNFVEWRKITRIIAQGSRTQTGPFFTLPAEIQVKIIKRACRPAVLSKNTRYDTTIEAFSSMPITAKR
jgi:hypothetical protein